MSQKVLGPNHRHRDREFEMLSNTVGHPGEVKRVAEDVEESLQVDESDDERQSDGLAGRQNPAQQAVRPILHFMSRHLTSLFGNVF